MVSPGSTAAHGTLLRCSSGTFYTSSRLVYAAGRERFLPAMFGRLHSTRKTPLNATLLQAAITLAFIVIGGGFRSLINFSVVASWAFYFLTVSLYLLITDSCAQSRQVLGLIILRVKEPMLERWVINIGSASRKCFNRCLGPIRPGYLHQ